MTKDGNLIHIVTGRQYKYDPWIPLNNGQQSDGMYCYEDPMEFGGSAQLDDGRGDGEISVANSAQAANLDSGMQPQNGAVASVDMSAANFNNSPGPYGPKQGG